MLSLLMRNEFRAPKTHPDSIMAPPDNRCSSNGWINYSWRSMLRLSRV